MTRPDRSTSIRERRGHFQATFIAMGSPCELLVNTRNEQEARALAACVSAEAWRIEDKFSRYLPGNIVDRINSSAGRPVELDDETASLIDFAATLYDMSDGRFDITAGVLRQAWTFDGSDNVPSDTEVAATMDRVGWEKISWSRPHLALGKDMEIDLGGIAKEYAVDKAAAIATTETDAALLVNFGGDLVATGAPEGTQGWQVGVDSPDRSPTVSPRMIRLKNGGLATSGDARRYLLKDAIRYSHILDPTTGWPVQGAPHAITVAADTCTQAGMLATLAMLRGDSAEAFLSEQDARYWVTR